MSQFEETVWSIVRDIPPGRVMTYGQVAREAKSPHAAQSVGNVMRALREDTDVPWQRVVRVDGSLSAGAPVSQREHLDAEGVTFLANGRVDLDKHQWSG